jgi:hypothetical protein
MDLRFKLLSVTIAFGLSAGCAGMSEQACLSSDWRTVGFEDGAAGRPVARIGQYREACTKHGVSPDLDGYRAGHRDGVVSYCTPGNGFDAGRRGAAYQGVCPAELEPDFIVAYRSGRHLYELESALRNVDARIAANGREQEQIKRELTEIAASIASTETSADERVALVARAADLGRRHGELTAETDALKEDRVIHERDLADYRQTLAAGF